MPTTDLYPLEFEPIIKTLLWGGRRLGTVLHKPIGEGDRYAESWELSDHGEDVSQVKSGSLAGQTLRSLIHSRGAELLGKNFTKNSQFPLLVKFLDANQVLSVQVHPNDELGQKLAGDNGKTETWVIIHTEPGSKIYAGLKTGVTREQFAAGMASGDVEPLLHAFEAKPGDCVMIPAGTVHAIGAGIVLAEIQQMSDATFRVFDWGRVGPDGLPRKLHPAESLESTNFEAGPVDPLAVVPEPIEGGVREPLSRCDFFRVDRFRLQSGKSATIGRPDRFTIVIGLEGTALIRYEGETFTLGLGQTMLLPAAIGPVEVTGGAATGAVFLTCVVP